MQERRQILPVRVFLQQLKQLMQARGEPALNSPKQFLPLAGGVHGFQLLKRRRWTLPAGYFGGSGRTRDPGDLRVVAEVSGLNVRGLLCRDGAFALDKGREVLLDLLPEPPFEQPGVEVARSEADALAVLTEDPGLPETNESGLLLDPVSSQDCCVHNLSP